MELTLEEIFFGCLKKVTHKRKVLTETKEYLEETRTLTIDVKPGLPTGTRFVFEGCVTRACAALAAASCPSDVPAVSVGSLRGRFK